MLANTQRYLASAPHLAFFPGVAIVIAALGFTLLGERLREALDEVPAVSVTEPAADHLLDVRDLSVAFTRGAAATSGRSTAWFTVDAGQTMGLVGESGSGRASPRWPSWDCCPSAACGSARKSTSTATTC